MINVSFTGRPPNYDRITKRISRSAQPEKDDFVWLKKHGVTDIVNFRTMGVSGIDFDEKSVVEGLGMKYHNIPTHTMHPQVNQVLAFLKLADDITNNRGKLHIHCKAGADRTGLYSFIYKSLKNIGSRTKNIEEWLKHGLHQDRYPHLIPWAVNFVDNMKSCKLL